MAKLSVIWRLQSLYNERVRQEESVSGETEEIYWTKQYLLGIASEIDEVLREINWKRHRKQSGLANRDNVALELADLTKYVFSLWDLWGYSEQEMLEVVDRKSQIVAQRRRQEYLDPPVGKKVLICDLDGTIADWRASFIAWAKTHHQLDLKEDTASSLLIDHDLEIEFVQYNQIKEDFENNGGYANLIPFSDGVQTLKSMQSRGDDYYLIFYTARPAGRIKKVWHDSWTWLKSQGIRPNELYIGGIERIVRAIELAKTNKVILFEDDPEFILRAAGNGIPVYARKHKYNQDTISAKLVTLLDSYESLTKEEYFGE